VRSIRMQSAGLLALSALAVALAATTPACENKSDDLTGSGPPYDLRFSLDATFQAPHGGQPIEWALVRSSGGVIEDQGSGTISATASPSFSFFSQAVMDKGEDYEIHYWIDSNIGGGTAGVCDPKAIDHQWRVELLSVTNDVSFTTSYQPALTEDVCATFP